MTGNLGGMEAFVAAVLAYTQMRLYQCERAVKPMTLLACKSLWWAVFGLAIMTALLKLARYEAIPVVLSFMIIYLRTRASGRPASYSIRWGAIGLGGVLVLFSLVALVRGAEAFESLMGYGPASFNHLAAVLSGKLQYKGTIEPGVYTLNFINNLPFIHRLTDSQFFNFDAAQDFKNEFDVAAAAGLNRHLIWITAFGYYFVVGLGHVSLFGIDHGALAHRCNADASPADNLHPQRVVADGVGPLTALEARPASPGSGNSSRRKLNEL
jgi:hypothetical protein